MITYQKFCKQYEKIDSLSNHIKKFGQIANETNDAELKNFILARFIPFLQQSYINIPQKSLPILISKIQGNPAIGMHQKCQENIKKNKADWHDSAINAGWVQDWRATAIQNGWTEPK